MKGLQANQSFGPINKRKKKRSLIQQVKKRFKKSASFSKGNHFDDDEYQYFVRIFELERKFDGTTEEKVSFANNALAQTDNREVECSFNQLISRVIENLLPLATHDVLERFYNAFSVDLRRVSVHEYASHVLQALMIEAAKHSLEAESSGIDHSSKSRAWLLKVSKFLLNNFEEFVLDKYSSPILRTSLYCLSGMPQLDKHYKQETEKMSKDNLSCSVSEECSLVINEYLMKLLSWAQFGDLVSNTLSSGFLQAFLCVLKSSNVKQYKLLRNKILTDCFISRAHTSISDPMSSPVALPVLDMIIEQNVKGNTLSIIYNQLICGKLLEMSTANVGNTTVQKLINNCRDPKMIKKMFLMLSPEFIKLINMKKFGVLVSLCQACERLSTLQSNFFQVLTEALNSNNLPKEEKSQLVMAIVTLTPLPHEGLTPNMNRHGSLLVQSLLKFEKPVKLVKSVLALEPKMLVDLLASQYGCHITAAFCKSKKIGIKSRNELINKLMDHFPILAQTKFGSRTFDDIWEAAKPEQQLEIVQSLSSCYSQLKSNQFGKFISIKVNLEDYRSEGGEKWKRKLHSQGSYKKMFASIIGDEKSK